MPIWKLVLDDDYSIPGDEKAEDALREKIWAEGAILEVNKSPGFTLHEVKQNERVAFSIEKLDNGSWQVKETTRTAFKPAADMLPAVKADPQEPALVPQLKAEELAVVRLGGSQNAKANPLRNVYGFGFDEAGKICALCVHDHKDPYLLYLTEQGEILKDIRVPVEKLPEVDKFSNPASVGGSKFVVTVSGRGEEEKASCYVADFAGGTIKEVPEFDCPPVEVIAGFPDGRFAALTVKHEKYSMTSGLYFYDIQGKFYWQKTEGGYTGKPDDFLSPEDIAPYGKEAIVVLDVISHKLQFFDAKGVFLKVIDLDDTWKRKPSYPTHVVEDSDGGLAIYDFDTKKPLVRVDSKGQVKSECVPQFADGRPVQVPREIRRAPDGRIWTTDGDVLLRLSEDGTVDRIIGEKAVLEEISEAGRVFVGPQDRIYVTDRRTQSVHVFDAHGKKEGVCIFDPKDLTEISDVRHIAAAESGDVFVDLDIDDHSYVHFDKNFKRVGKVKIELASVCQDWHFQQSGSLCWIGGYEDLFLVKDLKEVVRKISRRADRQWLARLDHLGVAPDGAVAVTALDQSGQSTVTTYSPAGEPQATFIAPQQWDYPAQVAYDGQTVFVQSGNIVYMVGPNKVYTGSFRLPFDDKQIWSGPFLAAEGKQLWFIDDRNLTVHKFAIPPTD